MFREKRDLTIDKLNNYIEPYVLRDVVKLVDLFKDNGFEIYLVGGCVRDLLLGKTPKDIDLCTNATPEQMRSIVTLSGNYFNYWDSGVKHGTLTITGDHDSSFEVTTFRSETEYTDHRHPNSVTFGTSLEEDLKRRDLTINSFALDITSSEIIMLDEDFKYDLQFGIIRCVGNPIERFTEDALRMLRAIRFSAQLGFSIEENTYSAIVKKAKDIKYISKERIRDELTKILTSSHPDRLDLLQVTGLTKHIFEDNFPEKLFNIKQKNKHHYTDVWHHTLDVLRNTPADFEIRWAALFHDIGKPDAETLGDDGYNHYKGHPEISVAKAVAIMQDLKFSNNQIDTIEKLVRNHDTDFANINSKTFKKLVANVGFDLFPKLITLREADALAHTITPDDKKLITGISKAKERFREIIKNNNATTLKDLAINGYDLIALGYKGKQIGTILNAVLDCILECPEKNNREFLLEYVKQNTDRLYNK